MYDERIQGKITDPEEELVKIVATVLADSDSDTRVASGGIQRKNLSGLGVVHWATSHTCDFASR